MNNQYILNRKLYNLHKEEQNNYLKLKIKKAKSFIDLKCPESFSFYKNKFKESLPKNTYN
jgi:hypothetical protein